MTSVSTVSHLDAMTVKSRLPAFAPLAALFVVGFVLRLALALHFGINVWRRSGSDAAEYDTYAWNIAQGRGYRGMSPE